MSNITQKNGFLQKAGVCVIGLLAARGVGSIPISTSDTVLIRLTVRFQVSSSLSAKPIIRSALTVNVFKPRCYGCYMLCAWDPLPVEHSECHRDTFIEFCALALTGMA